MIKKGKILAIDFGEKFTGLAVTDEGRVMVFARGVIKGYKSLEGLFSRISSFCQEECISLVVFGVPVEDEDGKGQSERFKRIGKKLESYLKDIPVEFEDEAFSSFEARGVLKGFDIRNLRNKYSEHEISAMIILERFLSGAYEA